MIADQSAALNRYSQDWPKWLREGIIDAAIPMAYGNSTPIVERQLAAAMAIPTQRQVWAGIAIYNEGARDAAEKIQSRAEAGRGWDRVVLVRLARRESGVRAAAEVVGAAEPYGADRDEVA